MLYNIMLLRVLVSALRLCAFIICERIRPAYFDDCWDDEVIKPLDNLEERYK